MSPTRKPSQRGARGTSPTGKKFKGFTDEERAAMQDRVKELNSDEAEGETAVLQRISQMQEPDRAMGKRIHAIVKASAPTLSPRLWYGMPAYANREGKMICHFQPARKFKTRYASLGFSDKARLDDGTMWPVAYALKELTSVEEARIGELLKKAAS